MKSKISTILRYVAGIILPTLVVAVVAYAGSLTPPSGTPTATSYTLEDIYQKLVSGTDATEADHDLSTTAAPAATFYTLTQLYTAVDTLWDNAQGPSAAPLSTGQTFCTEDSGGWTRVDCAGTTGQDGNYQNGVGHDYEDNGNGTVTDHATGLTWLTATVSGRPWDQAISYCETLDFAGSANWRLPNIKELFTLVDFGNDPSLSEAAIDLSFFPDTVLDGYWASTGYQGSGVEGDAWIVHFYDGYVGNDGKSNSYRVRCVRE